MEPSIETDHDVIVIIRENVSHIKETIDKLDSTLHGNGKEGLCVIVQKHDMRLQTIEESHAKHKNDLKWMIVTMIAAVATIVAILNYFHI